MQLQYKSNMTGICAYKCDKTMTWSWLNLVEYRTIQLIKVSHHSASHANQQDLTFCYHQVYPRQIEMSLQASSASCQRLAAGHTARWVSVTCLRSAFLLLTQLHETWTFSNWHSVIFSTRTKCSVWHRQTQCNSVTVQYSHISSPVSFCSIHSRCQRQRAAQSIRLALLLVRNRRLH